MKHSMNIPTKRTTLRKVSMHLMVIISLGTLGGFLLGAISFPHFIEYANKLTYMHFFQWRMLGTTMLYSLIGAIGVGLVFVANKFGDELWEALRHGKQLQL
ncbi:hypothetical protein [Edaphobacter dinghuensis]|uniref:Uncharacterized protein n=1 Tax=Edaphobacter dinghuensis TaxID=1560005 RepID=A0A917HRN3_9BACT|nr:hypothetical protein [Edaphobacter dinghuensis]GGG87029.1 hypothetical protein GCM10011585_33790 [Edaphobacter dinghuensis]